MTATMETRNKAMVREVASNTVSRILVVEDQEDLRNTLARLLRIYGFRVETAACVSEAIAALEANTFDLLLSDIRMPGGSGLDLMRATKGSRPRLAFAMSSLDEFDYLNKCFDVGFDAYLVKPFDFEAIKGLLAGELYAPFSWRPQSYINPNGAIC